MVKGSVEHGEGWVCARNSEPAAPPGLPFPPRFDAAFQPTPTYTSRSCSAFVRVYRVSFIPIVRTFFKLRYFTTSGLLARVQVTLIPYSLS